MLRPANGKSIRSWGLGCSHLATCARQTEIATLLATGCSNWNLRPERKIASLLLASYTFWRYLRPPGWKIDLGCHIWHICATNRENPSLLGLGCSHLTTFRPANGKSFVLQPTIPCGDICAQLENAFAL
ncbi:hypothetical protein AVEN_53558-1 [Araneus ventricosus]|uniref:Uncharacterized protein n=1 Tax=Araneus ventricosus TaxID=182803 RepID=A0A4Y2UAP9_ARAVE|nr:hypothetical protein AVEN_53558-1 [Araneus ventricosus]